MLGSGAGLRHDATHALVRVAGPDAVDYLHRLCSQDVAAMVPGEVRPACFLDGKGKLLQIVLVARVEDGLWLEAQGHKAAELLELLDRYHFTEQLTLSPGLDDWDCAEVWTTAPLAAPAPGKNIPLEGGGIALSWQRDGLTWVRYHGPAAALKTGCPDLPPLSDDDCECLRILAGIPWVGRDTDERTLALEAPLDDHVSTTKGCYTGQEIVARIHTYGHTNRSLCRLGIEGTGSIEVGSALLEPEDGDAVGRVMSVVDVPGQEARLGLGFVPAAFTAAGTELVLGTSGGPAVTVLGP
jgi:folate-binding protein YgfZ